MPYEERKHQDLFNEYIGNSCNYQQQLFTLSMLFFARAFLPLFTCGGWIYRVNAG